MHWQSGSGPARSAHPLMIPHLPLVLLGDHELAHRLGRRTLEMRRLGLTPPHAMSEVGKREPKSAKEDGSGPVAEGDSQREDYDDTRNGNYVGKLVLRQGIIPYRLGWPYTCR